MLKNWIKIYLYQIKNNKLFTFLNTAGLSIGIAGLVFAILYWNDEHSYNSWNSENEKVYLLLNDMGGDMIWTTSVSPLEPHLKQIPEVENHCYFRNFYFNEIIEYEGKKEQIAKIIDAQQSFFQFFPFEFVKGNPKTALQDKSCIALSEETAQRLFGNDEPMGKQVLYSGRTLTVRGIFKVEGKSSIEPMAVTSLINDNLKEDADRWGNFNYGLMIKIPNPAMSETVKRKIENLYFEYRTHKSAKEEGIAIEDYIKKNGQTKVILEQLKTSRLSAQVGGFPEGRGNYSFLLIMLGLSVLILILSIINYVNLATANAIKRAKEVGVRKIIGATKSNIIRQFVFETSLTTGFAILLALVIVELSWPFYNDFLSKELIIHGSQFFMQLVLIFGIVVLTAGFFPAIYVANFETLQVLKGNFGRSKSGIWLRNAMLILQFGIASFFIIGSYIVYQQVDYMRTKDLGFKGDQVISIQYRGLRNEEDPHKIYNRYETIKQEIKKIKGVEMVSSGAFSFGYGVNSSSSFSYKDVSIQGQNMAIDFNMLSMMKIKVVEGRDMTEDFSSDTINSVMINSVALKMMKEKNPIGKEIDWNEEKLKIVGIVSDFHVYGPQEKIPPMAFFHFKTIDWMSYNLDKVYVKVNPENMTETLAEIEKFWTMKVDTQYPFNYEFVDKTFAHTYETYVKQSNLFSLLNFVVILIALFGLFALASYSIQRRMKEIAIRKTLGAETRTLLWQLSVQYLVFCTIGFAIALLPAYYLLEKWLEDFAFRIEISFIPFVIGFLVLLALTLLIVLSKAFAATRVDVLKYLKYE